MDTVYPEPTSMLYRRPVRKKLRGNATRYRTQPVTFAEIQEVDEENIAEEANQDTTKPHSKKGKSTTSEININLKFDEFRKLRDKRYSKSENDSPSPDLSPILSPSKDPGVTNPLDVIPSFKMAGGVATPGKIIQRPSI